MLKRSQVMAFKPDRHLLNANFEGYKLSSEKLPTICKDFAGRVDTVKVSDDYQRSYQHVKALTMRNQLILDPWEPRSVYWRTEDGSLMRGTLQTSQSLAISPVYSFVGRDVPDNPVNASIVFLSEYLCLFSDGRGTLQLLNTGQRADASLCAAEWKVMETLHLEGLEKKAYAVLDSKLSEDGFSIGILTMELLPPEEISTALKHKTKPTLVVYNWYIVHLTKSIGAALNQSSSCAEKTIVAKSDLLCSLKSEMAAEYWAISEQAIMLIGDSNLRVKDNERTETPPAVESRPVPVQDDQPANATETAVREEEKEEEREQEEEGEPEAHHGFGYHKDTYEWTQSATDVTIKVQLPADVTKQDISCTIGAKDVVVGLVDGTTFARGALFAPVDPVASSWTIQDHVLEVILEKKEQDWTWTSLFDDGRGYSHKHHGENSDHQDILQKKLEELQSDKKEEITGGPGSPAEAASPLVQYTLEECDAVEDDVALFVFGQDGSVTQRYGLGGHQLLFTAPAVANQPPFFCLRHDIDALLWQPEAPLFESWKHMGTFNALGYVQASKRDRKFSTCAPNLSFAVMSDCNRHIFVYRQPSEGIKGNAAQQYVHTLATNSDRVNIFGLQASSDGVIFVLCERELLCILLA